MISGNALIQRWHGIDRSNLKLHPSMPYHLTFWRALRWLETVFSTCTLMGRYNHSLPLDATIMV